MVTWSSPAAVRALRSVCRRGWGWHATFHGLRYPFIRGCTTNSLQQLWLTASAVPFVKPGHVAHVPEEYITNLRVHDVHKSSWT
jgi:hypothetical protein